MKVMKAFGPGDLRIVEVDKPEPEPGYVRVKARASGICGSDKGLWHTKVKRESVAGHEVAGEVDKLGDGVLSLKLGDRVMINNVVGCGNCPACRNGAFVLCPYWDGTKDVGNGFGEYLTAPARNCVKILPGLDFIDGALIMDNWGTPYGGIQRGAVDFCCGSDVLVNGCGPIGQAAVVLLKSMRSFVIACDPVKFRRDSALENGADVVCSPDELPDKVYNLTNGQGAHAALECSGNGAAYENCIRSLRIGGTLIAVGEGAEYTFQPSDRLIRRSLSITGTWYSTLQQAGEVMRMALLKQIDPKAFLSKLVTLDETPAIFGKVVNCEDNIIKCVIVFD